MRYLILVLISIGNPPNAFGQTQIVNLWAWDISGYHFLVLSPFDSKDGYNIKARWLVSKGK